MRKFAHLLLALTTIMLLLWQLPWLANFVITPSSHSQFTLYSSLADDFIYNDFDEQSKLHRYGVNGQEYTEAETDSLLPCFYMRQLVADGRFPDSIQGHAVTPHMIQQGSLIERFNPKDINCHAIPLYPLMESMPKRVELEMPEDVFRITEKGIEFITMESNSVNENKSKLFTQALLEKGFHFPALQISGNPSTRKAYDEGYLLLDANRKLFQLKRCAGRPFVKEFGIPQEIQLEYVFAIEPTGHQLRGLVTDRNQQLYVLTPEYSLIKTGVDSYNPATDRMLIIGNIIDWTVSVTTDDAVHYYALSTEDYHLIKRYDRTLETNHVPGLHFTSADDTYCYPRF